MEAFLMAAGASLSDTAGLTDMLMNFIITSSLERPFLVAAEEELIAGVRAPTKEESAILTSLIVKYLESIDANGSAMIADFEGEMPGHGGELVTAAFLSTDAVDSSDHAQHSPAAPEPQMLGILVDLRCHSGISIVRQIMGSARITKLIWGADADLQSLMYQKMPIPLAVDPVSVIDIQLAFSEPNRRLGMKRMLETVPSTYTRGLPSKQQIDFDKFHSRNCRSMPLPLSSHDAKYAVDDLHRIEAILQSKMPPHGSYTDARSVTDQTIQHTRQDRYGLKSLERELAWFDKSYGQKKLVKAVEIKRHILTIPIEARNGRVQQAENKVNAQLESARVRIPADLSFAQ